MVEGLAGAVRALDEACLDAVEEEDRAAGGASRVRLDRRWYLRLADGDIEGAAEDELGALLADIAGDTV
jgi:hypothetical protein